MVPILVLVVYGGFNFILQTLQKEITQKEEEVALLLKAGNDLLDNREGASGSDEIQVSKQFPQSPFS